MESGSLPYHHVASTHFLMQIGQDVQKQEDPQRDIVCIFGLIAFHGKPRSNLQFLYQVLKQNIEHSPPQQLKLHGLHIF